MPGMPAVDIGLLNVVRKRQHVGCGLSLPVLRQLVLVAIVAYRSDVGRYL